ncbi:MAG: SPOR domain-containing protein [Orrella sp.]
MGLFSRKEAGSSRRHSSRPRPSVSSEAQAATLKVKARRRLTGAVALVLAVVVVLPMLLDGEPKPVPSGIDITIPSKNSPYDPVVASSPQAISDGAVSSDAVNGMSPIDPVGSEGQSLAPDQSVAPAKAASESTDSTATQAQQGQAQAKKEPAADKPSNNSNAKPATESSNKPTAEPERTDDGSRALALLEGKSPETATANAPKTAESAESANSRFIVQIASYSGESDAKARQEKLKGEGVSNAFVESSVIDGKTMYRLRVGPFGSREAAQAAQTRLRTLGYSNGFIATQ